MQIILHIGTWKTGSSAVQLFMARNADLLERQNVYLPSVVRQENGHTILYRTLREASPARDDLIAEMKALASREPAARMILSSEHFWPMSVKEIDDLAATLRQVTDDVRVLVYLRPQDEMWGSIFAQQTKSFRVRPEAPVWGTGDFVSHAILDWALYYHKCLGMFGDAFGDDAIVPRLYRREDFPEKDVIFDFLDFAGIQRDPDFDRYEGDTNPSFGWKSVAMSLWFVGEAYAPMRKANSLPDIRRAFRAAIGDMYYRNEDPHWLGIAADVLNGQDRRDIRAHYAEDNQRLFDRYFGGQDVFGAPADTPKVSFDHTALPAKEFNRARARMLKQFRKARLDMQDTEGLFQTPTPLVKVKDALRGLKKGQA